MGILQHGGAENRVMAFELLVTQIMKRDMCIHYDAHFVAAALPSEEFESFGDELCVELEDAAVAGVGVGHQLTVRQAAGQVG